MKPSSPLRRLLRSASCVVALGALAVHATPSCEEYEPVPTAVIEGLSSGVLSDSRAPIVIDFGVPVDESTARVKIALLSTDIEGNLGDEDEDEDSQLKVVLRRDPDEGDINTEASFDPTGRVLTMVPKSSLAVGPKLVLLVEPGIRAKSGRVTTYRQKIPFSYIVKCAAGQSTKFASGVYFMLLDVLEPIGSQIQVFAAIEANPTTGALVGQFTNADRNPRQTCPMPCSETEACRLLPAPECVQPSLRAATAEEYPDFVPNIPPPTGYSFEIQGCAVDDGTATGVVTAPTTVVVQLPAVTIDGLTLTAQFAAGEDGVVRATGSLTAETVRLGTNPLGVGKGTMTAVKIPDDRIPPDVPRPPISFADAGASDGGADANP